ncbi:MAG: amidophosphoribosyltransferase, partial [Sphingobacteriales bacterium]|nr:amidophosphoribosyltransferase [Sphingobacteriales bacterium]
MSDIIRHECGIALIRLLKPLSYYTEKYKTPLYGLNKLYILMEKQHNRGQDGAGVGIVSLGLPYGKEYMYRNRSVDANPIASIFRQMYQDYQRFQMKYPVQDTNVFKENLPFLGELLLGHLRYGTYGGNDIRQCHPVYRPNNYKTRSLLIAGNFNMTNNDELFNKLVDLGQYPLNLTDTLTVLEKIGHFLDSENEHLYQKYKDQGFSKKEITDLIADNLSYEYILSKTVKDFDGGYVIAGLIGHGDAFVIRDPNGIRPAFYYHDDEVAVVASEKPAIRTAFNLPYQEIHELKPGHGMIIKRNGKIDCIPLITGGEKKSCSFERIYFSRGTDEDVYRERKKLGKLLAPKVLDTIGYDLENTVLSYIPNTAEVAFLGLVEGLNDYLDKRKKELISSLDVIDPLAIERILSQRIRVEKIAVKDTKIRTFITEDTTRTDLVSHVYDSTYGLVKTRKDNLVVLDDSIVRGTTLRESIIKMLDRLEPDKLIIVSSAPQIRYPDCYGIDMSKLKDFVAFRAAIELLKENNMDYILRDVYRKCKEDISLPLEKTVNHVREIYAPFNTEQITAKIEELIRPPKMIAKLHIIYQSIEDLHRAIPDHSGDWYFTGNYPTPGGNKV